MFIGWVPSITGRLSYSQIGKIGFPKANFSAFEDGPTCSTIRCAEIRTKRLDDSIFQLYSLASRLNGINTVFEVDAIAVSINDDKPRLTGKINCYTGKIRKSEVVCDNYRNGNRAFEISFCLNRAGLLVMYDLTLGASFANAARANARAINLKHLVDESYFFLKDMVHRHRHHHHYDDTFLRPIPYKANGLNAVAYQLGRRVIRRPINKNLDTYQSAVGILAYLRSCQSVIGTKVYTDEHLDNMKESLSAEHSRQVAVLNNKKWLGAAVITFYSFGISKFVNWQNAEIIALTTPQFFAFFGLLAILVITAHYTYVFNWSEKSWFIELQKYFASLQYDSKLYAKGRLVALLLFILFSFISYGFAISPEMLNIKNILFSFWSFLESTWAGLLA